MQIQRGFAGTVQLFGGCSIPIVRLAFSGEGIQQTDPG